MPNRLADQTSPYLQQHADNPVDWYPWGAEALARARTERRPILLSIGYAACHWCHVMAHESFEDEETARLMNERFVNVKVDREERPDLDAIYMQAVQAMTGHGGWPMTVFLTPEGVPFYGGTYFPREDRYGMPSFRRVLASVADAWTERGEEVARAAATMRELYAATTERARTTGAVDAMLLERAAHGIAQRYDPRRGGFEGAPKFPQAMTLEFLLQHGGTSIPRAERLRMVLHSFRSMARGGIYDQVGGGFARYSVDANWLVPHFEKMLYDNALLVRLGAHLWQATKEPEVRRVTEETIEWLRREMTSPDGGFYSSLDADSEGHEGKFYVWDETELDALLGDDAAVVKRYFGVTSSGNFEGRSILYVPNDLAAVAEAEGMSAERLRAIVERARATLYEARAKRVWPGRDDKILASWNALMVRALAETARAFGRDDYRAMALRTADFLFRALVRDGRVMRSYKDGESRIPGYLEDHASLGLAALSLYELTFDGEWLARARSLGESMVQWFWDDTAGAFYDTASDHEELITRPRDPTDNATPSGTSLAAELLARLAELTQDEDMRSRASYVVETLAAPMGEYPTAFGHLLGVAELLVRGGVEVALVGDPTSTAFAALERAVADRFVPRLVLAGGLPDRGAEVALLADRPLVEGRATAYVCRNYACERPAVEPGRLAEQLAEAVS
jgi:uncharacterized protein YyaL (SSP411 family)